MLRFAIWATKAIVTITVLSGLACTKAPPHTANLVTTDFPNIQAALDALPAEGGVVVVPAGIHKVRQPLRISRSNVSLRGEGRGTVIVNENRDGKPAIIACSEQDPAKNPLWGVTISNMCITGDTAAIREARAWPEGEETQVRGGDAILADHCYNSLFEKLWLVRNGGNGLNLYICYEDPRVVSCVISYNRKAGLRMEGCHDIAVSASHFEENYQEGLLAVDTWNIAASGNDFDDNRGSAVVLKGCVGCPLSGNLYTNSPEWGLVLDNCRGNTLTGEIIRRNLGKGGVWLKNSSFNTITGCSFDSNDSLALVIDKDSQQNSITGNVVSCLQSADKTMGLAIAGRDNIVSANIIAPGKGFGLILSGENQNVSGNIFVSALGKSCILIENLRNSAVRGNILRSRDNVLAPSTAIVTRGSNSGNRIEDNR